MKKIFIFVGLFLLSCGKELIEKPDNLIPQDQMTAIFYDLSLLEAIRTQRPIVLQHMNVQPTSYIYKKYKIDSIQFVKSNAYYASNLKLYKEMYDEVAKKIEANKKAILSKPNGADQNAAELPQIQ